MLGNPSWFVRRKYLGWGIMPKTWQGWVYLVVILIPVFVIQFFPGLNDGARNGLLMGWAALICIDIIDIMRRMKYDERDKLHEALAERNALWIVILVLVIGFAYRAAQSAVLEGKPTLDPVILSALIAGLIAKAATNFYLDHKD
jgi:hypothetical protein